MDGPSKEEEEDSTFTNISLADDIEHGSFCLQPAPSSLVRDLVAAHMDDLSARVDAVKEENLKLKSENQVLGQYIENLMSASSVFQTTDTKSKRK
ncbi:PREDICTED: short coiled-coil protein isoform X1 [Myotis davidii]|uniref:short coiled-coil protein isoform X1 n=1 Tax=Myotis davidii TaxID=225400 RepID=UPI000767A539|nr:PREDICTED: short coiled-coil protein isoform X1 [Myotis davidii]